MNIRILVRTAGSAIAVWMALPIAMICAQTPNSPEREPSRTETRLPSNGVQHEQVVVHPTEGYFAAYGGYTFGGKFDAGGTGVFNGVSFGNGSLANSAVVGAKAGGFFPSSLNWFGVEAEL